MSGTNQLQQPLGAGVPMPGGQLFPAQRRDTLPHMDRMAGQGGAPPSLTGPVPAPRGGAMSFADSRGHIEQQHMRNKNALKQMNEALKKLDAIRKGLTGLAEKQDTVTMDDVVHEAGKLVGHGIDPLALAGVLADAPQEGGGEALGAWIAGHAQNAMQAEAQLMQQRGMMQHQMGMTAVHMAVAHANGQIMDGPAMEQTGPGDDSGNALGGGGGGMA